MLLTGDRITILSHDFTYNYMRSIAIGGSRSRIHALPPSHMERHIGRDGTSLTMNRAAEWRSEATRKFYEGTPVKETALFIGE